MVKGTALWKPVVFLAVEASFFPVTTKFYLASRHSFYNLAKFDFLSVINLFILN